MSTERDELVDEIAGHPIGSGYYSTSVGLDEAREIADAILAAGYRKPQQVTTVEELEALPVGSVVMDHGGFGEVYRKADRKPDGVQWYEAGYTLNWGSKELTLPAVMLHVPVVSGA